MNSSMVSILMPVYNGLHFLDLAVKSVINQTYSNWELLIIDDGSTDSSLQCIRGWAKVDNRIKVFFHEGHVNRGVSATRNLGILNAQGKYLALLDCDDEWFPDKLERQVRILDEHPDVALVYCKAVSVDEENVPLALSSHFYNFPHLCGSGVPGISNNIVNKMIMDTVWMPALTVMMKLDNVKSIGGFDETLVLQVEDHLLFTLVAVDGPVYFLDEILANYRVHPYSYTQTTKWKYSMLEYYDRLYIKLPTSFHKEIYSARLKLIVNELVTIKSFVSRSTTTNALKIVGSELFDDKVPFSGKMTFVLMILSSLFKQSWHSVCQYSILCAKRVMK